MIRRRFLALGAAVPAVARPRQAMFPFRAKSLDGKAFSLESMHGKVVLIQHWATWCGYCRKDEPAVEQILADHAKDGLVVLAVNAGEERAVVESYLKDHKRTAHIVLAPDTDLGSVFQRVGVPAYLLLDRAGNVAGAQPGSGGLMALRELLKEAGMVRPEKP